MLTEIDKYPELAAYWASAVERARTAGILDATIDRSTPAVVASTPPNHPRRTPEESRRLTDAGWFEFPELTEAENDVIFRARLAGYAACYPVWPDAQAQARATLQGAKAFFFSRGLNCYGEKPPPF